MIGKIIKNRPIGFHAPIKQMDIIGKPTDMFRDNETKMLRKSGVNPFVHVIKIKNVEQYNVTYVHDDILIHSLNEDYNFIFRFVFAIFRYIEVTPVQLPDYIKRRWMTFFHIL
jgi:hypothetical protein